MESKTKNKKTREQLESMAKRAFNGQGLAAGDEAVREMKEGWFNVAYGIRLADGREVVLKIAPPQGAEVLQYEKNIMTTEVTSMRLAHQNPAIPVPQIYFYDDAHDLCDADYFFMEMLSGENLEHAKASLSVETQAAIDLQIGTIIREINRFPGTYFGYDGNPDLRATTWREAFTKIVESVLEDAIRKNATFDYSYEEIRAAVMKHAPTLDEVTRPCMVHWDAWNPNFFVQAGKVTGILDFERVLWAEPLMEAQFRYFGGDPVSHAMRGYGKIEFTAAEEQRKRLYDLHLALVMNVECYYRNYDTDEIFNFSKGYIATTMEWLKAN